MRGGRQGRLPRAYSGCSTRESPPEADKLCAELPWGYTGFRTIRAQDSIGFFVFNLELFVFQKEAYKRAKT